MLAAVGLLLNVARRPAGRAGGGLRPRGRAARRDCAWSTAGAARVRARAAPARGGSAQQVARVVIAAGGTAGHVVPAIAVADALRAEGAEVSFLGTRARAEAELVPAAGYEIDFLRVRGLDRRNPLKGRARALARRRRRAGGAPRCCARAARRRGAGRRRLRRRARPGSRRCRCGLPLVLTEADSHLGLANRLLARRARRVCLAFPISGRDGGPYVVTGRPVPAAVLEADRVAARERFGIGPNARCLLVFGGSLGARSINDAALEAFAALARRPRHVGDFHVLHVAGRRDYAASARAALGRAPPTPSATRCSSTSPTSATRSPPADLVVARAGGSVFELAAAGRPAILVPYPHATGRPPDANAALDGREAGAAVVIPDAELKLGRAPSAGAARSASCSATPQRLARDGGSRARAGWRRPDAAERIAHEILRAAERG